MKTLSDEVIQFFHRQNFTVVTTIGRRGIPHNSCKGIVRISRGGRVYLLDLYKGRTFANLKQNPHIAITAVDEHRFKGFCLKGRAQIVRENNLSAPILRDWEKRLAKRITQRLLKNIKGEKGHARHPEALFPAPEYLIRVQVEEVVDLTPQYIKD